MARSLGVCHSLCAMTAQPLRGPLADDGGRTRPTPSSALSGGRTSTTPRRRSIARLAVLCFVATAVLYAPLAVSYMWFAFDAHAPQLQVAVSSLINGREYATGRGSVVAVRTADYSAHRIVMLVHTSLGGLALLVSGLQFSPWTRRSRQRHRAIGRLYLTLMSTSMLTAMVFLVVSSPVDFVGQQAFRLQLWVLAVSTLGSAWVAATAIRLGDALCHRAFIGMNLSFMMTAPLLRVLWTVLEPVFPGHVQLSNLNAGAVLLAVTAPAAGASVFMLTGAGGSQDAHAPLWGRGVRLWLLWAVALLGAGLVLAWPQALVSEAVPASLPWFHVLPAIAFVAACSLGVVHARTAGDAGRERSWTGLMAGGALAPWAVVLVGVVAAVPYGPLEGYLAGLMVAPGVPIVAAFGLVVSKLSNGKGPAWQAQHGPPDPEP